MSYDQAALRAELERDEAKIARAYDDGTDRIIKPGTTVKGNVTIAIGRNLTGKDLAPDEIDLLYENDRRECERDLDANVPWWRDMTDARQRALVNICWSGWGMLRTFTTFLALLQNGEYEGAADDLLRTKYAAEVHDRATRLAEMIRAG